MPAFQTRFEDLPAEIAIFPLGGALLLPGGRLPLNIFEPRYLAMVEDSMAAGRLFGMVQGDPAAPRRDTGSEIYRIGCLGRLSSFAETEDGRLLITLTGVIRYRIAEEVPMRRGYRRARADYADFRGDLAPDASDLAIDRAALLAALPPYFTARGIDANWQAVEATPDGMLVTTLCMICPFEIAEKQALLEAPSLQARAEMLVALLRMGAHGMAPEGPPS